MNQVSRGSLRGIGERGSGMIAQVKRNRIARIEGRKVKAILRCSRVLSRSVKGLDYAATE